jgi:hypothetical protein
MPEQPPEMNRFRSLVTAYAQLCLNDFVNIPDPPRPEVAVR